MVLDVLKEIQKLAPIEWEEALSEEDDYSSTLTSILGQFRDLKRGDLKIVSSIKEVSSKIEQSAGEQAQEEVGNVQDWQDIFFSAYDCVQNMRVAAKGGSAECALLDKLLSFMEANLAKLGVVPFSSVGECYDPHVHEGFVVEDPSASSATGLGKFQIVEELRKGFRVGEKIVRRPWVKFVE